MKITELYVIMSLSALSSGCNIENSTNRNTDDNHGDNENPRITLSLEQLIKESNFNTLDNQIAKALDNNIDLQLDSTLRRKNWGGNIMHKFIGGNLYAMRDSPPIPDLLQRLINKYPGMLHETDNNGATPLTLFLSSENKARVNLEAFNLMMASGADINKGCNKGDTVLHLLLDNSLVKSELLPKVGNELNKIRLKILAMDASIVSTIINKKNDANCVPLHYAKLAMKLSPEVVLTMLEKGADIRHSSKCSRVSNETVIDSNKALNDNTFDTVDMGYFLYLIKTDQAAAKAKLEQLLAKENNFLDVSDRYFFTNIDLALQHAESSAELADILKQIKNKANRV